MWLLEVLNDEGFLDFILLILRSGRWQADYEEGNPVMYGKFLMVQEIPNQRRFLALICYSEDAMARQCSALAKAQGELRLL